MEAVGKIIIIFGIIVVLAGVVMVYGGRLGFGRLPGDIIIKRENFVFFFPLATSIIISVILTIVLGLIRFLGRR